MYEKFVELMKNQNVTPYKVGKETNISSATFSDWKSGKYTPKIDKLQKIAKYFGVSIEYFLENQQDKQKVCETKKEGAI